MPAAHIKRFFIIFLSLLFIPQTARSIEFPWTDFIEQYKERKLQQKQEEEAEPMVQTIQEWMERATDIKMEHRIAEPYKEEENPNLVKKLEWPVFFEKYNNTPGSREFNLEKLKTDKSARSRGVISPDYKLMAYTECYYYPSSRRTTSAFFIYPLDTMKGKKQRVIDANVFAGAKKKPLISSTDENLKTALFSAFTVIDWSKDNKKILLKEQTGSSYNGIYKTTVWLYFLDEDIEDILAEKEGEADILASRAVQYDELNEIIKQYWFDKELLNLNHYRWDIKPLGFMAKDENIVAVIAYTYDDKNKEHLFLGSWGINIETGEIDLLSESAEDGFEISTNSSVLIRRLP